MHYVNTNHPEASSLLDSPQQMLKLVHSCRGVHLSLTTADAELAETPLSFGESHLQGLAVYSRGSALRFCDAGAGALLALCK